ncbi:hypothetical protein ACM91S_04280 [Enterobacter hormaechei]|uniref:hypothetical protein n=1 Tax=Enterobacter hormaechei TaxID=158836 RepID=UPI003B9A84FC
MSTITTERAELKSFITGFLSDPAHDNQSSRSMTAEVFRIALASLEAKPIGAFHIADQRVDGTSDYIKDGEWPIDDGVIEVYAAPPAPVVPNGWVLVPVDMPHEMMRAVQVNSELGAYAATNLNGAYSLFREFWDVAVTAAPQQEMNT